MQFLVSILASISTTVLLLISGMSMSNVDATNHQCAQVKQTLEEYETPILKSATARELFVLSTIS